MRCRSLLVLAGLVMSLSVAANPFDAPPLPQDSSPWLPHLSVEFQQHDLDRLRQRRDGALQQHVLETGPDDFLPAVITLNDDAVKAEIRLKGDFIVHLEGFKWSYRVKVRGDDAVLGLKTFSLQHPRIRLFLHEYVILQAMQREGLISPRYEFVKLSINGTYLGIYNLEEHFESRLLERQHRIDAPIVKIDETFLFQLISQERSRTNKDDILFIRSPIETFQKSKVATDPRLRSQFEKAVTMLDAFRRGTAAAGDIFDLDEYARYFAVSDVFMGKHGNRWHNQRFYFNPLLSRLQPIAFDFNDDKPGLDPLSRINRGNGLFYGTNWAFDVFSRMLFSDPDFFTRYLEHMERLTHPRYLRRFFEEISPDINRWESALGPEFRGTRYEPYATFDDRFMEAYFENQRYVRNAIHAAPPLLVHAQTGSPGRFVFENRGEMPVEVFQYVEDGQLRPIEPVVNMSTFRFKHPYSVPRANISSLELPSGAMPTAFRYRIPGGRGDWLANVGPTVPGGVPSPAEPTIRPRFDQHHPTRRLPNADQFEFIHEREGVLRVEPGRHKITAPIIIGKDSRLVIPAGTRLDFSQGAWLLSWSAVDIAGTPQDPVELVSSDGSGGGVIILDAPEYSSWKHVRVVGLGTPGYREWRPPGVVTFYRSSIDLQNAVFMETLGEDALNIVNSEFTLRTIQFTGVPGDAVDLDYSQGRIYDMVVSTAGNDALDVSGSKVYVSNLRVRNAGDKAVSVGGVSRLLGEDVRSEGSHIGIAVKDDSVVSVEGLRVRQARVGIAAYRKKSGYSHSTTELQNATLLDVDIPILFERSESVIFNGRRIATSSDNKQKLLIRALRNDERLD